MVKIPFLGGSKIDSMYEEMHTLFLRDAYKEAEHVGHEILEKDPDHKETMLLLAQMAWNKEHFQKSREWYNKILYKHSGSRFARVGRARCSYQLYKFEDALDDYLTLYETSFKTLDYLIALGDTYQKLNLHKIALRYYERAIEQDGSSIKAHIGLGYEYIIMGRYKEAIEHAQKAKDIYYKNKQEYDRNVVDNIFGLEEQVKLLTKNDLTTHTSDESKKDDKHIPKTKKSSKK